MERKKKTLFEQIFQNLQNATKLHQYLVESLDNFDHCTMAGALNTRCSSQDKNTKIVVTQHYYTTLLFQSFRSHVWTNRRKKALTNFDKKEKKKKELKANKSRSSSFICVKNLQSMNNEFKVHFLKEGNFKPLPFCLCYTIRSSMDWLFQKSWVAGKSEWFIYTANA